MSSSNKAIDKTVTLNDIKSLISSGKYLQAIQDLTGMSNQSCMNSMNQALYLYLYRSHCKLQLTNIDGSDDLALLDAQQAIKISPNSAAGYLQAGIVLLNMQKFKEAEEMMIKAIKYDPSLKSAINYDMIYIRFAACKASGYSDEESLLVATRCETIDECLDDLDHGIKMYSVLDLISREIDAKDSRDNSLDQTIAFKNALKSRFDTRINTTIKSSFSYLKDSIGNALNKTIIGDEKRITDEGDVRSSVRSALQLNTPKTSIVDSFSSLIGKSNNELNHDLNEKSGDYLDSEWMSINSSISKEDNGNKTEPLIDLSSHLKSIDCLINSTHSSFNNSRSSSSRERFNSPSDDSERIYFDDSDSYSLNSETTWKSDEEENQNENLSMNESSGKKTSGNTQEVTDGPANLLKLHAIWVANLSPSVSITQLKQVFSPFGKIIRVDHQGSKPFCFIHFDNPDSPVKAIRRWDGKVNPILTHEGSKPQVVNHKSLPLKIKFTPSFKQTESYDGMSKKDYKEMIKRAGECPSWRGYGVCTERERVARVDCPLKHDHASNNIDNLPVSVILRFKSRESRRKGHNSMDNRKSSPSRDRKKDTRRNCKEIAPRFRSGHGASSENHDWRGKSPSGARPFASSFDFSEKGIVGKPTNLLKLNGIWVAGIDESVDADQMRSVFSVFGQITKIICSKRVRYGFVHFDNPVSPVEAMVAWNRKYCSTISRHDGKLLKIKFVASQEQMKEYNSISKKDYNEMVKRSGQCPNWRTNSNCNFLNCRYQHIEACRDVDTLPNPNNAHNSLF